MRSPGQTAEIDQRIAYTRDTIYRYANTIRQDLPLGIIAGQFERLFVMMELLMERHDKEELAGLLSVAFWIIKDRENEPNNEPMGANGNA